jgi:hypothetical protein
MKKILTVITAAVLVMALLAACGAKKVELGSVMDSINSTYSLSGMKTIEDTDSLNRYYQIDPASVKQFAAQIASSAKDYNEIVIIEATDSKAAESIKTQLDARLRSQLSNAKSYDAGMVSMIEACEVKVSGNYVYLVIGENHEAIVAEIEKAIK